MNQQALFRILPLLFLAMSTHLNAQLVDSDNNQSSNSTGGVQNQNDNAVDTFLQIQVQVKRVVKIPSKDGELRVIVRIVEEDDIGRRLALIKPQPTLLDDLGNVYVLTDSTGVQECSRAKGKWEYGITWCTRYVPGAPVKLTPSQPLNAVLTFSPSDTGYAAELANIAENATLQARFGLFSDDLKTSNFADVVINGIELPKGGS